MMSSELIQTLETLPETLQKQVLHYAKHLAENYTQSQTQENQPVKCRRAGTMQGMIWMSDDFDEPLDILRTICNSVMLLDTHALLWFLGNDSRLPISTKQQIETAELAQVSNDAVLDAYAIQRVWQ